MNTVEVSRAPKSAKLCLLFAVLAIFAAFVETTVSPIKEVYQNSPGFRMQCVITWIIGTSAAVFFGVRALRQRQSGDRQSVVFSVIGLVIGGGMLGLLLTAIVVGMLSR